MQRREENEGDFSKKLEDHVATISLHFMYYNFARIRQTLRIRPAMAAGVTGRCGRSTDILRLMDEREAEMKAERRNSLDGPALGGPDISRSNGSRLEKRG
ncbi:MAG TPA: hypothetical protein VMB85_15065, partial [Bryobacteraceae bacterium]|nr:hypothetical protein [Bryobacteraceae bacterium]